MQSVRLLGICGSPRKHGNSRYLLERALAAAGASLPGMWRVKYAPSQGRRSVPAFRAFGVRSWETARSEMTSRICVTRGWPQMPSSTRYLSTTWAFQDN